LGNSLGWDHEQAEAKSKQNSQKGAIPHDQPLKQNVNNGDRQQIQTMAFLRKRSILKSQSGAGK
jgi:hypothetical protein